MSYGLNTKIVSEEDAMLNILVIDDDLTTLHILGDLLVDEGHFVKVASDGKKGLQVLDDFNPDLIITDIEIPEFDGLDFIQAIKNPVTQVLPCKVMVMSSSEKHLTVAKSLGVDATFTKPLDVEKIIAKLNELCDSR